MGGPLGKVRDGDVIRLNGHTGVLDILADPAVLAARCSAPTPPAGFGYGRELFGWMRKSAGPAETGACVLFGDAA